MRHRPQNATRTDDSFSFILPFHQIIQQLIASTFGTEAGDCLEKNNDARDQPMDDGVA